MRQRSKLKNRVPERIAGVDELEKLGVEIAKPYYFDFKYTEERGNREYVSFIIEMGCVIWKFKVQTNNKKQTLRLTKQILDDMKGKDK
jgi:hypothetical protein